MEPERPAWVTSLAVLERGSELSMASTAISAFDIRNVEKRIVSFWAVGNISGWHSSQPFQLK